MYARCRWQSWVRPQDKGSDLCRATKSMTRIKEAKKRYSRGKRDDTPRKWRIKRSRTRSSSKKIRRITRWRNSRSSSRFFSFSSSAFCAVCGRGKGQKTKWDLETRNGFGGGKEWRARYYDERVGFSPVERKPLVKMPAIKRFQTVSSRHCEGYRIRHRDGALFVLSRLIQSLLLS